MKTLDEAIEHCYEKASKMPLCDCAKEHIQLAQWLEELKAYREAIKYADKHSEEYTDNVDEWHGAYLAINEIKKRVERL